MAERATAAPRCRTGSVTPLPDEWRYNTMSVHVRPYLPADRETISALVARFSEFDLPNWRSADDIDRTNRLSLQKALDEPAAGAAILVADDEAQGPVGFIHLQ